MHVRSRRLHRVAWELLRQSHHQAAPLRSIRQLLYGPPRATWHRFQSHPVLRPTREMPPLPAQRNWSRFLFDASGQPKPQTENLPRASDPSFQERIQMLCSAIIGGHPDQAHAAFFPLAAYRQVKAVADPDRDYRLRLLRNYDRDITDYHRRISSQHGTFRCSGIRLPKDQARWMKPGSEYNRIGYFRVLRAKLDLTDTDGNTTTLEVTSLISWRGQWYIVHLHGFE